MTIQPIRNLTAAFLAVGLLLVPSCTKKTDPAAEREIGVSARIPEVPAAAGSVFVSVTASSDWTLDLDFKGGADAWAQLSGVSDTGDKANIILAYGENISEESRSLDLVLESGGRTARFTFNQRGDAQTPPGPSVPAEVPKWMELPAYDDGDDTIFAVNMMKVGGVAIRNYSYCYDERRLLSHWVAYPLNEWLRDDKNVGRYGEWMYDPTLPSDIQPNWIGGGIGPQGYSRGHQIPSEDRQNAESNQQTFYMTNVTPQNQDFNETGWLDLENKVRSWARASDTLYVVSGCVVEGSPKSIRDNNGRSVPVPAAYYKVLLRYSKSSTFGFSGYSAAAFYMEHEHKRVSLTSDKMMSVDEIEKKLGMDFFVNLPDEIEELVEKQNPATISWWGVN